MLNCVWIFYSSGDYHDLTGRPNKCSMFFWEAPPSCWKTLSPGEIPIGSSTLLEITTILLEDQINVLCSSGKHHRLFPGEIPIGSSTLLEITTILLEDQINVLCSSGKHHRLQGRSHLDLLLFWRLPQSC